MAKVTAPTTVGINGFALREIRVRSGLDTLPFAKAVGISRPYLARIELGERRRVSPSVFAAILRELRIADRRAILADPHTQVDDLDGPESGESEALSA